MVHLTVTFVRCHAISTHVVLWGIYSLQFTNLNFLFISIYSDLTDIFIYFFVFDNI